MALLRLNLQPETGNALDTWDDLETRLRPVLPRVQRGFGVQEVFAHDGFFLRIMLTEMPSRHVFLTIFGVGRGDPGAPDNPAWALRCATKPWSR